VGAQLSKPEKIERVQKEIRALERKLADSAQVVREMLAQKVSDEAKLKNLQNQLKQLKPVELTVSDHALLRYAERHCGFPFDRVREEIAEKTKALSTIGDFEAFGFVVRNNTVITYRPLPGEGERA
jgi:biopolymer transport protein ExbB/TolQ